MKKVLVVDDSISVRKALERILKPKKVEVLSADSAKAALEILEENNPELIIADIVMPEMDGYEFCSLLKQHERLKTIPVLLISGIVNPEVKSRAKEVKAIGIVKKPFKPDTLLYIVSLIFEKLKSRPAPPAPEVSSDVEQSQNIPSTTSSVEMDPAETIPVEVVNVEASQAESAEDKLAEISFDDSNQIQSQSQVQSQAQEQIQPVGIEPEMAQSAVVTLPQSAKEYQPEVLEAAAKRFMGNVKVDNLWLLDNETQSLLHLGSARADIETDLGKHFDAFYRTASEFAKARSYSPMNSLLLEYPETCYLLVEVNELLLMVLDFQDVSALSMVRYMMRKELPELAAELEGVPVAA